MKTLKNTFQLVKLIFKHLPFYVISSIVVIVLESITLYLDLYIVEHLIALIEIDHASFFDALRFILIISLISEIIKFLSFFQRSYIRTRQRHKWIKIIQYNIFSKAKEVSISYFDNPDSYDRLMRAMNQDLKSINAFDSIINIGKQILGILTLVTYMLFNAFFLFIIGIITSGVSLFSMLYVNKEQYKYYKDKSINDRQLDYIGRAFYLDKYALDIKTTTIKDLLYEKHNESYDEIEKKWLKNKKKILPITFIEDVIYQLGNKFFSYVYLTYKLFFKGLSIAKFTPLVTVTIKFNSLIYRLSSLVSNANQTILQLSDLMWLLSVEKPNEENLIDVEGLNSIEVKNVSFVYQEKEKEVLSNISMDIKKGKSIALIGKNGAGKTTLTKLLLKLYEPTSGQILIDGVDYKQIKSSSINKIYTTVLQNFQIYCATIIENVLMRKPVGDEDIKIVTDALKAVGLYDKLIKLPNGLNTILTKEFSRDGLELSGGERQKLAIARAFASGADVVILDEPTSALDPLSEKSINEHIISLCEEKHKTLIIITHRLSTVVNVNKIYMIEEGKVVEEGTHEALMSRKGKYFEMFSSQAMLYNEQAN